MRTWLLTSVLALASVGAFSNRASAWWHPGFYERPITATVSFPMQTPSGYFTNTYYYAWHYPWYQNYNYSHGSYSNWMQGGGYAYYAGQQMGSAMPQGHESSGDIIIISEEGQEPVLPQPRSESRTVPGKKAGTVTIGLPADAKLHFNGALAGGSGESRTFLTPELNPDQDYEYVLTAEVIRDGQTMTASQRVIVRAGETTSVTLTPAATARK